MENTDKNMRKIKAGHYRYKRLICRIFGHKWKRPIKSTEGQEWYVCDRCLYFKIKETTTNKYLKN